jgi:hypothetical protein
VGRDGIFVPLRGGVAQEGATAHLRQDKPGFL